MNCVIMAVDVLNIFDIHCKIKYELMCYVSNTKCGKTPAISSCSEADNTGGWVACVTFL